MRIIESDVSGVWGPEIKAIASQARATHTHTQKKMRTPCRASEAAAWLIKAAWHPYPSLTSRCRASRPGSQPRAPLGKLSDLGTQTSFCPFTPSTITQHHLEARSVGIVVCVSETWGAYTSINGWGLQLQGQCYCRKKEKRKKRGARGEKKLKVFICG